MEDTALGEHIYLGEQTYDDTKFYWSNIEPQMIVRALKRIKSKAVGADGLSPALIMSALPSVLPIVGHIFNHCLTNGVYPDIWRSALICPIPKVKCPTGPQQ